MLAFLPSPSHGVWHLGPVPIRAYALTMIAGMVVAGVIGARRLGQAGYRPDAMWDVALWGIPFGIVGARLYHVLTSPAAYFGPGGNPWKAFAIWEGGLGIWGSIALGAVGGAIAARRLGIPVAVVADALAPGLAAAQAVGRLGNWFNQELFGAPTTLPWGLQVSAAAAEAAGFPAGTLFHPTFLYELLWDVGVALVLIWGARRWRWGHGQVFFAYMFLYCLGRVWIEMLRVDQAGHFLGLRLNVWTAILVGTAGLACFIWSRARLGPAAPPPPVDASDAAEAPDASVPDAVQPADPADASVPDAVQPADPADARVSGAAAGSVAGAASPDPPDPAGPPAPVAVPADPADAARPHANQPHDAPASPAVPPYAALSPGSPVPAVPGSAAGSARAPGNVPAGDGSVSADTGEPAGS